MSGAPSAGRGKKRRAQAPLEPDASLYGSFSAAANSVTALFASAHAQGQRCYAAGARDFADRLLSWATEHEASGVSAVPTKQLVAALHAEVDALEEAEMAAAAAAVEQHSLAGQVVAPTLGTGTNRERAPSALSPLKTAAWGAHVDATGAAVAVGGAAGASFGGPLSKTVPAS